MRYSLSSRLVVDGTDEIFLGLHRGVENRARFGIFLGLGEHEGGEVLAREFSRAVEEGAIEIFINGDLAGIKCGKGKIVAILEFFPVDVECFAGGFARVTIPAVGHDDAADVPEECGDAAHGEQSFQMQERIGPQGFYCN